MEIDDPFKIWTIYHNPLDFPGKYVGRLFNVHSPETFGPHSMVVPTQHLFVSGHIEPVRDWIKGQGATIYICKDVEDDPNVVESWIR